MKKKTYPPELTKLLSFRIVDAIVASPLLEDENKLLALEDLRQMYSEPEYFEKAIGFCSPEGTMIISHHHWNSSKLGGYFWSKINAIIGEV